MEEQEDKNIADKQGKCKEYNRIENIRPFMFKKGQSGNPSGRAKGSISFKEYLDKIGNKKVIEVIDDPLIPEKIRQSLVKFQETAPDMSLKEAVSYVTWISALVMDKESLRFIVDRTEGQPVLNVNLTGAEKNNIDISKISDEDKDTIRQVMTKIKNEQ